MKYLLKKKNKRQEIKAIATYVIADTYIYSVT